MSGEADPKGYVDKRTGKEKEWDEDEKEFLFDNDIPIKRDFTDFKKGLKIPGKLLPKRIPGGILLVDGFYEMR